MTDSVVIEPEIGRIFPDTIMNDNQLDRVAKTKNANVKGEITRESSGAVTSNTAGMCNDPNPS